MTMPKSYKPLAELISLTGRKAIVTGGAGGIGFAIACRLAEAGAAVTIADASVDRGEKANHELRRHGYKVFFFPCDVSQEEDVRKAIGFSIERMGGVDILVNNAGIFPFALMADMNPADFDRVIAVNLRGLYMFSREASRLMIEQKRGGCIINVASIDAVHPSYEGLTAYDASKGGVLTLTRSMARELAKHDIRVNAIAPGAIMTEGAMASMSAPGRGNGSRSGLRSLMAHIPLGKMGIADDIGRVALFLASDLSSYMTGTVVVADGGYLIA